MTTQVSATSACKPFSATAQTRLMWISLAIFVLALTAGMAMVFVGFQLQGLVDTKFDPYDFGAMGKSLATGQGFAPFGVLIDPAGPADDVRFG